MQENSDPEESQHHVVENRQVMLLSREAVSIDWLGLFSLLPSEFWSDWHPLLFVPMDLGAEWSRWVHSVRDSMNNEGTALNMQAHGEYILLIPHNEASFSRALQMRGKWSTDDGCSLGLIIFRDGDRSQDKAWIRCILSATASLATDLVKIPWKAAIGPYPHQNLGQPNTRLSLSKTVRIGEMIIEPLNQCVVDRSFSRQFPSLSSLAHSESWPLSVSGTSLGYERSALRESVTRDLVLLSAVFSLATGIPWIVRELPFVYGDNEIHMSKDFYGPLHAHEKEGPVEFDLPDWANDAYYLAKENEDYCNALLMFSESLQLEGSHPSITLIAFMSCLQSLGRIIERNEKKQLKAILRTVRDESEVKRTLRYYGHRSETAHRGVLWGSEDTAHSGGLEINPFVQPHEPFWSGLWQVKGALIDAFSWILNNRADPAHEEGMHAVPAEDG